MILDTYGWNRFLSDHVDAHILQSAEWGELKSQFGWSPMRVGNDGAGAQILIKKIPAGFSIAYIPKGPVGNVTSAFWKEVEQVCRQQRSIFLKIEPDFWSGSHFDLPEGAVPALPIQPAKTIILDLSQGETQLLANLKQKTRYNIHLAEKKEIEVSKWDDLVSFSEMMNLTATRDGFGVHSGHYYQEVYRLFHSTGACELFCAKYQGTPLAAIMVFASQDRAWYFYGASTDTERNRMPTYLLQWHAIQWAISRGCRTYDLWGIPNADERELEEQFSSRSDGLWGVYRFKRGFGGEVKSSPAWDVVYQPLLYKLYSWYSNRRRSDYTG